MKELLMKLTPLSIVNDCLPRPSLDEFSTSFKHDEKGAECEGKVSRHSIDLYMEVSSCLSHASHIVYIIGREQSS